MDSSATFGSLTPDDLESYRRKGYWISPRIIPDDLLDLAEHGMRRQHAGDTDVALPDPGDTMFWGWRPADGDVLRKNDYSSLRVTQLAQLVRYHAIGALAAQLAAVHEIRLWHDQLLYKPPSTQETTVVGWHTDRHYWRTCSSDNMITAWVPFHDVTEAHGPVLFLPGSHRWEVDADLSFFDPDLSTIERYSELADVTYEPAVLSRGQVSFHHCRVLHASSHNRSGQARRSIAIHMQPGDNHWVGGVDPSGAQAHHALDQLVRSTPDGVPDYADPRYCPRLWPADERQ
jgi:ectoine hydroxylase-related dioxygenase (phytanoyl-CoA dioxygenase family)